MCGPKVQMPALLLPLGESAASPTASHTSSTRGPALPQELTRSHSGNSHKKETKECLSVSLGAAA